VTIIGWELAAKLWREHLPDPLSATPTCYHCGVRMPCACWRFADTFLTMLLCEARSASTRGTAQVRRRTPLPQRHPNPHPSPPADERRDGWFTR
jgi:hypothetical protein